MVEALLDTNILIRFFTSRPPSATDRVTAILAAAERRGIKLVLEPIVLAEVIHVLETSFRWPRPTIAASLRNFLTARPILVIEQAALKRALAWYESQAGLDFEDAYVAARAIERGHGRVVSFDRDFSQLAGIVRIAEAAQL